MAERLGRGLQNLVQQFDSARDLIETLLRQGFLFYNPYQSFHCTGQNWLFVSYSIHLYKTSENQNKNKKQPIYLKFPVAVCTSFFLKGNPPAVISSQ